MQLSRVGCVGAIARTWSSELGRTDAIHDVLRDLGVKAIVYPKTGRVCVVPDTGRKRVLEFLCVVSREYLVYAPRQQRKQLAASGPSQFVRGLVLEYAIRALAPSSPTGPISPHVGFTISDSRAPINISRPIVAIG